VRVRASIKVMVVVSVRVDVVILVSLFLFVGILSVVTWCLSEADVCEDDWSVCAGR